MIENSEKSETRQKLEAQNKRIEEKIDRFNQIVALLQIRRKYFLDLSNLRFMPKFLAAKYRIKGFEIEAEIIAKLDLVRIYAERVINVDYAEKVIDPDKKGEAAVTKLTALKNEE